MNQLKVIFLLILFVITMQVVSADGGGSAVVGGSSYSKTKVVSLNPINPIDNCTQNYTCEDGSKIEYCRVVEKSIDEYCEESDEDDVDEVCYLGDKEFTCTCPENPESLCITNKELFYEFSHSIDKTKIDSMNSPGIIKLNSKEHKYIIISRVDEIFHLDENDEYVDSISANNPTAIAIDDKDNIYVVDEHRIGTSNWGRVRKISPQGNLLHTLTNVDEVTPIYGYLNFYPHGITISEDNRVFLSKSSNYEHLNAILIFDEDGALIKDFKEPRIFRPKLLDIDSNNNLYVQDHSNKRFLIFEEDLDYIGSIDYSNYVNGIAIDNNNNVFLTDKYLHRVLVFNGNQEQISEFTHSEMNEPSSIATYKNKVYVSEPREDRISVFELVNDECSEDSECDDGDDSTLDLCAGKPKKCSNTEITICASGDNFCPATCTYETDKDCDSCQSNSECEDNNVCTTNKCEGTPKRCEFAPTKEGCSFENKCLDIGERTEKEYCSIHKSVYNQKESEEKCDKDYECISNQCVEKQCYKPNLIQNVLSWFGKFF